MQCTKPIDITVARYGNVGTMKVPCGKCAGCRIARSREWSVRMVHEADEWKKSVFATLTYSEEQLPADEGLDQAEFTKFWKRLRKDAGRKLRYYACGEYGEEFGRPHYHAVIFGLDVFDKPLLDGAWSKGFVNVKPFNVHRAKYIADYILKSMVSGPLAEQLYGDKEKPFARMSKGMGKAYALRNAEKLRRELSLTMFGERLGVPRYYCKILGIKDGWFKDQAMVKDYLVRKSHQVKLGKVVEIESSEVRFAVDGKMEEAASQRNKTTLAMRGLRRKRDPGTKPRG